MIIVNALLYYLIILPISLLPFPLLYGISNGLYVLFYYVSGYRKKVVLNNLRNSFPDKTEEEKVDLSSLGNAGYRVYDAFQTRQNLPPARSVVDLHIEKLTNSWKHLTNFEILTLQLNEYEKYYELAVAHRQQQLIIIHGVGEGKLRDEIHESLKLKAEVKSFVNQFHPLYGYGATEIYFK